MKESKHAGTTDPGDFVELKSFSLHARLGNS